VAYALSLLGLRVVHFIELWDPWGRRNESFGDGSTEDLGKQMQMYRLWGVGRENMSFCLMKGNTLPFRKLEAVDAVFDSPFPEYSYDLIRAFPNARVVLTVREPSEWVEKRIASHTGAEAHFLRPCGVKLSSLPDPVGAKLFEATNDWVTCVGGPDRFLKIDVFKQNRDYDLWDQLMRLVGIENATLRDSCQFPREPGILICGSVVFHTNRGDFQTIVDA